MPRCAVRPWLEAGWGFVSLGVGLTITAFLLGVVYFSIRTVTTSLEHVDIVPTYVTALLLCCVGILTMFMYKRRDPVITVPTMVLTFICLTLTLTSFVLIITKVIPAMVNFRSCQYNPMTQQCRCYTMSEALQWGASVAASQQTISSVPYNVGLRVAGASSKLNFCALTMEELVYREALSCSAIEINLLHLACTQCGLFLLAFLLSALTTALTAYIVHRDRRIDYLLEEEEQLADHDFETLRADNLSDPLIGQYRQLTLTRQIALPDASAGTGGTGGAGELHLSGPLGGARTLGLRPDVVPCTVSPGYHHPQDGQASFCCSGEAGAALAGGRPVGRERDQERGRDLRRGRGRDADFLWDGYCIQPEDIHRRDACGHPRRSGSGNGSGSSGQCSRPVCRSQSDGGQWSMRPLLLPSDPLTTGRARARLGRRARDRPRSRSRRRLDRLDRHRPYVTFVPVPYSMYRPNALLGLGISPFPMEPPPPYCAEADPPPYTGRCAAPAYTSRSPSPAPAPGSVRPQSGAIYENIPVDDIGLHTRI